MDIRLELKAVIEEFGHDLIYVRRDKRFRCSCYSERTGSISKSDCPECFGLTYKVSIEKIRSRSQITSVPESLPALRGQQDFGIMTPKAYVYYMEHFTNPKEGDLLLEVQWENGQPKSITEKNLISVVDAKKGDAGRTEFYQVYCRLEIKGRSEDEAIALS